MSFRPSKPVVIAVLAAAAAAPFAAPAAVHAQEAQWRFEKSPTDQTLRAASAVDHDHAWIAGGDGDKDCFIGRTDNGGAHWQGLYCDAGKRPESMDFVDARNGWIVGRAGLILHTTNGGDTWDTQRSGTSEAILNVYAIDARNAVAVTRGSEILVTNDGGGKWNRFESGKGQGLFDSYWFDPQNGFSVGSAGLIIRTTDGGRKWRTIDTGSDQRFYAITFTTPQRGYTLGNDLRFSDNGGESWRLMVRPPKTMADLAFAPGSATMGWVVGDEGLILRTTDGVNWRDDGVGLTGKSIRALAVVDGENLWAVGTDGLLLHRVGPREPQPEVPTERPTSVPPTRTPVPPTVTPTPTPTQTPTPSGPWVRINADTAPLLVGTYGARPVTFVFGNLGASEVLSATLAGPALFANGEPSISAPVFPINGQGTFAVTVKPAAGAQAGQPWTILVRIGAAGATRGGMIAWQSRFPWLALRHR